MTGKRLRLILIATIGLLVVGALAWGVWTRLDAGEEAERPGSGPAPVEVAEVTRGTITERRTFSGTLTSPAEIRVAANVGGRIEQLTVDLSDIVERGQVVAELDSDEYRQAVAQAQAELAVAQANLSQSSSAHEIAARELQRIETLQGRGVVSEAQFDTAKAEELAARSRVEVAQAEVLRSEAALERERIRLSYTTVTANWTGDDGRRVVAERFVEEGDTIASNTPLLSIVKLDPIRAVVYVTEREYPRLQPGQRVTVRTDAFPGGQFEGQVARVSPVFNQASRQARVELIVPNPELALKPGMFIRAEAVLDRAEDVLIVPQVALTHRGSRQSLFVLDGNDDLTVRLVPVDVGIREGHLVQLTAAEGIEAGDRVVTLGQHMLDDGSEVTIPDRPSGPATDAAAMPEGGEE